jgi:hypothetical protein
MSWKILATASLGVLLLSPSAHSAPPEIKAISPLGVRRGSAMELTFSGTNLDAHPQLVAPFPCKQELVVKPGAKPDASQCTLRLSVPAQVALGAYPIRIQTDDGLSNPFLLAIGQLPQVAEKEDNSVFETAQLLPETPLVVEGQVADNDVDFFRFHGKKGEQIVIDAQCARIGSGVDPTIRLTTSDATRTFVASADDSLGLLTDARLVAVLPRDGDYVIELSDSRYQGGGRPVYRLIVGSVPMAEEVFPLGGRAGETVGLELRGGTMPGTKVTAANLKPLAGTQLFAARLSTSMLDLPSTEGTHDVESLGMLAVSPYAELREPADPAAPEVRGVAPVVFNGRMEAPGDEDRFKVTVTPGQRLKVVVHAADLGSSLDAVLQVLGNGNAALANADDRVVALPVPAGQPPQSLVYPDPSLEMTVPAGVTEVTLSIHDLEKRGGLGFPYRIVVEPLTPDFELLTNESEVNVPRGGSAAVGVTVRRNGYSGPITLGVDHPPAGLTARPAFVSAGQTVGALTLEAAPDAKFTAGPIVITGQAKGSDGVTFDRTAKKELVFALQVKLPTNEVIQDGLFTAPALPSPLTLQTPPTAIEIAPGGTVAIPVTAIRQKGADGALTLSTLPLPPGLSAPAATVAEKKNEGTATLKAAAELPLGKVSVALLAKGKFPQGERSIAAPSVTLEVVRPASVELATPKVEIKPGTTVEIKGKVVRKGGYAEPVNVRFSAIPAGLKADPVTVAAGTTDFVAKLIADPKAAATTATAQVGLGLQVDKKDYPIPSLPLAVKVLAIASK